MRPDAAHAAAPPLVAKPHERHQIIDTHEDCICPRTYSYRRPKSGVLVRHCKRCWQCDNCLNRKYRARIGRTMQETRESKRSWFITDNFGWDNIRVWLCDHITAARLPKGCPVTTLDEARNLTDDHRRRLAQWFKANKIKRLKKQDRNTHLRQMTAWERHKSGLPHAHIIAHEQAEPIARNRWVCASFIQASGRTPPRRNDGETDDKYYGRLKRHCWHQWKQWEALRDDPSPAAAAKRLTLAFQPGRAGQREISLCYDAKKRASRRKREGRAASYAHKTANYTAKEGGRWYHSPRYGRRSADSSADKADARGQRPSQGAPVAASLLRSHVRLAGLSGVDHRHRGQELSPYGASSRPPGPLTDLAAWRKAMGFPDREAEKRDTSLISAIREMAEQLSTEPIVTVPAQKRMADMTEAEFAAFLSDLAQRFTTKETTA